MSDDDLKKRLREDCDLGDWICGEAANRIEELEADLRKMALDCLAAQGQAADAYEAQLAAEAKLSKSEALLAKAVGQMQRVKDYRYDPNIGIELNRLEEALAELGKERSGVATVSEAESDEKGETDGR
jgi:hypothetical protein